MSNLPKSYYERRQELRQALYRIEGAIGRYEKTSEIAEIGTIAVELRGLLCAEALFLSLAEEKEFRLQIYTFEPPFGPDGLSDEMKKGSVASFSGDCVSLVREKPWTNPVTVKDWLDLPVVEIKGSRATPRRLINEVASNLGPAHYSPKISSAMAEMRSISIGGVPSYFRSLFTFAKVLVQLGKRFMVTH